MNIRTNRRRVALAVGTALAASVLGYVGVTINGDLSSAEALQRAAAGAKEPYTAMGDYVDTLIYWHHHPDWSL
jgi:hypothetical protein